MSDFLQRISNLSPDRLLLLAGELKTRLERAEGRLASRDEPIAVVGVGCRFPGGGDSPDGYWRLLRDGVDAVSEVPSDRWDTTALFSSDPDEPGKATSRWGSFLNGLEDFDPWFFGISPREALGMDPQQRVLLEVVWEALENAGIAPESLEGTATGVFLGLCNNDFHALRLERPYEEIDSYFASGVAGSMASGRISYLLGLHGPSFTVDTACSSSLVALHLACESIRNGESRTALAAGVSLILTPETMIGLSKSRILSGDGRCRTFDADAGGIARGEGCGVVVLKRLSDARADGDRVLAVVRATGVNQDGRSNGITAPNGPAQEALLRQTLARSGLAPGDIDYVEAHGTGTTLGDPIEVRALASVYGDRPADRPLRIGSVKTNMGHLEASAGIAGFIKVVLALQAREIPPHLHLKTPNPHIEWDQLPLEVATDLGDWNPSAPDAPRRGAVSAFGFSGTNAHAILEQAPAEPVEVASSPDRSAHVLVISARTEALLRQLTERYAERLEGAVAAELADICHTAATGRNHFAFRLSVAGTEPAEMAAALRDWLASGDADGVRAGRAISGTASEPVFVFTGQGSQSAGMGRELFETEPIFRAAMERCDAILRDELPVPLLEALYGDAGSDISIDRTDLAQPALFALEYSLAELWRSWGVEPVAVIGHSLGEYVAATVAGLMSLEDGLRLVARRGRLMHSLPAGGAMASIFTDLARVEAAIAPHAATLSIAAVNGPENVVVSGDEQVLAGVLERFEAEGVSARRLVVSGAFHSPLMDPVLDEFEEIVRGVRFRTPEIAIVSNLTGDIARPEELSRPGYWREHLRRPVRFMDGVRALEAAGYRTFLEVGPHPTLTGLLAGALTDGDVTLVNSLRRGRADGAEISAAAGALHVRGVPFDWQAYDAGRPRSTVSLPTTPFDRRRFWQGWSARAHGAAPAPAERAWTWELGWEAADAAGAADLDAIAARLTESAPALVDEHGAADYDRGLPLLDRLSSALIIRGLRALGYEPAAGETIAADALRETLGVREDHRRLFRRMLEILREDGFLEATGPGEYRVPRPLPDPDPTRFTERLLAEAPAMRAEVEMTVRCAEQLAPVLRGVADPLELLFPGGSTDEASALYAEAPSFRVFNALVRDAVVELAAPRGGRPVRILEVGGGTGGVTRALLPALPKESTEYHFTDISPLFISRAKERFAEYPGFRGGVLDLSRDAGEQGFEEGSFDIVVASNVLHATPDIRATLSRLHTLLAPGGSVVVLEGVLPQRFGDLTVGLTDGWWSFTDTDLRPDYALMDPARWATVFETCGFEASADMPRTGGGSAVLAQQRVLLARKPALKVDETVSGARWLAVTGGGAESNAVVERLTAAGLAVTTVNTTPAVDLAAELAEALRAGEPVEAVLDLVSLDASEADPVDGSDALAVQRSIVESALACVSALIAAPGPRLVLVTRGAEATSSDEGANPAGSSLWGLARGAALEHPELRTLALDLGGGAVDARSVIAAVRGDPREDQVAVRGGVAQVPRIRAAVVPASAEGPRFRSDGAYLITGGLRGLGLRVARWMAEHGAGTLLLAGRSEPDAAATEAIAALEASGAAVRVVRGDVSRMEDVQRMIAAAGDRPLRGVMHSAGTTDDASLAALDWERTERVMRAKVAGSWNLHLATREHSLDHFVLFSSGAAFLGSPGQANHAMANNVLAAIAQKRRAAGLPGLSVDWGPWGEIGAATRDGVLERAQAAGLGAIDPEQGLDMLGRLLLWDRPRIAAVPVQWGTYLERIPGGADRAWFDGVRPAGGQAGAPPGAAAEAAAAQAGQAPTAAVQQDPAYLASRLGEVVAGRRLEVALDGIRSIAGRVLGAADPREIDPVTPLTELGLDSLMAVEMRNRLAAAVGRPLPATLLFNHPSLEALADFVVGALGGAEPAPPVVEDAVPVPTDDDVDLDSMSEDEVADLLAARLRDV